MWMVLFSLSYVDGIVIVFSCYVDGIIFSCYVDGIVFSCYVDGIVFSCYVDVTNKRQRFFCIYYLIVFAIHIFTCHAINNI